ncbi:MAG: zinc finger CDGSH-type domain protein [Cenarchaeum symbiont of Oopsacas minuta]|nr:zinc finger CDGSH-type domain protein [Cenarchaeum symbiont of Oopsacas minuta]
MPEWTGKPVIMTPKSGEIIAYCMCGLSKNGPVCDGSHKDTGTTPHVIKYDANERISACGCKSSNTLPICDGTHKNQK